MIEEDELKLKSSRFGDFRGVGDDLHAVSGRSETGREEFGFSFLLDNADATGAEGDEPAIVAERGDANADRSGSFEKRRPFRNFYSNVIYLQSYLASHVVLFRVIPTPYQGRGKLQPESSVLVVLRTDRTPVFTGVTAEIQFHPHPRPLPSKGEGEVRYHSIALNLHA
jgi:hypothetical protein